MSETSARADGIAATSRDPRVAMQADFQKEIDRLAVGAVAEIKKAGPVPKPRFRRRFSILVWTGVVLIFAEAVLLLFQIRVSQQQAAVGTPLLSHLIYGNDCRAVMYATYRGIVRYERENGKPPKALDELLGKYLDRLPADPATGRSLVYSSDGMRFSLGCPENARR